MGVTVIDNFLPDDEFKILQENVISNKFPVYIQNYITKNIEIQSVKNVNFVHTVYKDNIPISPYYEMMNQILFSKLEMCSLIRSKVNCYPRTDEIVEHDWHIDYPYKHKGALLYLNTCNGKTRFHKDTVKSQENRIVFFDSSKPHASTSCTDQKCRWNINVNYF